MKLKFGAETKKLWKYKIAGKASKPVDIEELKSLILSGKLTLTDEVREQRGTWRCIFDVPILRSIAMSQAATAENLDRQNKSSKKKKCVFCRKKPRRPAAGVCHYPMERETRIGGTYKRPLIKTERLIIPVPICESCGSELKKRGPRFLYMSTICGGLIGFSFWLKYVTAHASIIWTGLWIFSFLLGLIVLPIYFLSYWNRCAREAGIVTVSAHIRGIRAG